MNRKLTSREFIESDYSLISDEIKDAKALMQWAGSKYEYPLSWEQMRMKKLEKDEEGDRKNWLFTVVDESNKESMGHGQLTIIEKSQRIANIGSVLVFSEYRGRGYSKSLMRSLIKYGFENLRMKELRLAVFDFNLPAIKCYRGLGFTASSFEPHAREIEGEKWNLIRMSISRYEYEKVRK